MNKKKSFWPWIFVLVFILVGSWIYIKMSTRDVNQSGKAEEIVIYEPFPVDSDKADVNSLPRNFNKEERVIDFLEYVNSKKTKKSIGKDNVVTLQAIVKMSQALNAISTENKRNAEVVEKLKEFNGKVNDIIKNPALTDSPSDLKKIFTSTSEIVTEIQKENYPSLVKESRRISNMASSISPDKSVVAQQNKVEDFFVEVADIIDEMEQPS
ncbi:hypothetical protein MYP_4174 [Sporocytophaga myxococcoides]|uniref:Uncharacterized protein n=1 Tax=Sporocytophaga myxococcoides TaxID=153721 RepID=A0A098LKD6_9BACT|nr:hypothetical protein [Sporocytophaga myxococcoides]GAL86944.1 hypothetical protein MYP_4174 [Sporocytophaga myxococcoides]